jgi:hypothetical protein
MSRAWISDEPVNDIIKNADSSKISTGFGIYNSILIDVLSQLRSFTFEGSHFAELRTVTCGPFTNKIVQTIV